MSGVERRGGLKRKEKKLKISTSEDLEFAALGDGARKALLLLTIFDDFLCVARDFLPGRKEEKILIIKFRCDLPCREIISADWRKHFCGAWSSREVPILKLLVDVQTPR